MAALLVYESLVIVVLIFLSALLSHSITQLSHI
jgi:hypothetical protein